MTADDTQPYAHGPRAEAIAQLNDDLRTTGRGGVIVLTEGVRHLPGYSPRALLVALSRYDAFDSDNDPYGERDFGALELFGARLLWKIDYFDLALGQASPDAADARVTQRVLTIMLASEY